MATEAPTTSRSSMKRLRFQALIWRLIGMQKPLFSPGMYKVT